jgi:GT2 family glycosyltransferase
VVVVDNASSDHSLEQAQEHFPHYTFIHNEINKGFAGGMNTGMRFALNQGAELLWLFNNDATALPETLTTLVEVARTSPVLGLLSPRIFNRQTEAIWFAKGRIDAFRMRAIHQTPSFKEGQKSWYDSDFVTGCALLIRRKVVESIGFLDERFFLYYEDADYSLRAQKNGFRVGVVPQARVYHSEQSQANPQKLYYLVLSGLLFFEKHASVWQKPYFLIYGTIRRIKNMFDRMRGRAGAQTVYRAYQEFYHDA